MQPAGISYFDAIMSFDAATQTNRSLLPDNFRLNAPRPDDDDATLLQRVAVPFHGAVVSQPVAYPPHIVLDDSVIRQEDFRPPNQQAAKDCLLSTITATDLTSDEILLTLKDFNGLGILLGETETKSPCNERTLSSELVFADAKPPPINDNENSLLLEASAKPSQGRGRSIGRHAIGSSEEIPCHYLAPQLFESPCHEEERQDAEPFPLEVASRQQRVVTQTIQPSSFALVAAQKSASSPDARFVIAPKEVALMETISLQQQASLGQRKDDPPVRQTDTARPDTDSDWEQAENIKEMDLMNRRFPLQARPHQMKDPPRGDRIAKKKDPPEFSNPFNLQTTSDPSFSLVLSSKPQFCPKEDPPSQSGLNTSLERKRDPPALFSECKAYVWEAGSLEFDPDSIETRSIRVDPMGNKPLYPGKDEIELGARDSTGHTQVASQNTSILHYFEASKLVSAVPLIFSSKKNTELALLEDDNDNDHTLSLIDVDQRSLDIDASRDSLQNAQFLGGRVPHCVIRSLVDARDSDNAQNFQAFVPAKRQTTNFSVNSALVPVVRSLGQKLVVDQYGYLKSPMDTKQFPKNSSDKHNSSSGNPVPGAIRFGGINDQVFPQAFDVSRRHHLHLTPRSLSDIQEQPEESSLLTPITTAEVVNREELFGELLAFMQRHVVQAEVVRENLHQQNDTMERQSGSVSRTPRFLRWFKNNRSQRDSTNNAKKTTLMQQKCQVISQVSYLREVLGS